MRAKRSCDIRATREHAPFLMSPMQGEGGARVQDYLRKCLISLGGGPAAPPETPVPRVNSLPADPHDPFWQIGHKANQIGGHHVGLGNALALQVTSDMIDDLFQVGARPKAKRRHLSRGINGGGRSSLDVHDMHSRLPIGAIGFRQNCHHTPPTSAEKSACAWRRQSGRSVQPQIEAFS